MEVRLNKRFKIKQLFALLGIKAPLTFKSLFKPAIFKKVLLHYLDEVESKRSSLIDYKAPTDKALLAVLVVNNPTLKPKQIVAMLGFKRLFETMTAREVRMMFPKCSADSWYRLMREIRTVQLPGNNIQPLNIIRTCIATGKALNLDRVFRFC